MAIRLSDKRLLFIIPILVAQERNELYVYLGTF